MSHARATALAVIGLVAGAALLIYVLRNVAPYAAGQLNPAALLLFLTGVFLLVGGASVLAASALHRRWPALAGVSPRQRRKPLTAEPALRQGILAGLVAVTLLALAIMRVLDVAVLIVTLLVAGLVEAYAQSRQ
jgi:hypothetical protein